MDVKQLDQVRIKNADKGEVSAVFSRFEVIDHDGDVTLPGAFTDGQKVRISAYNHESWGGALPVGKGFIRTTDTEAILEGQFFLGTTAGRDTFETVKQLDDLGEWSYGYDTDEAAPGTHDGQQVQFLKKLTVHEVSPVLLGAGIGTRTLATKGRQMGESTIEYKAAIRPHTSQVTNREWDAAAVESGISDDASVSQLRSVYAWVDSNGDPEAKSSYKFPHHHGVDGPANVRALLAGIAALNGARGGSSIPEGDRKAVYNHLAGHLRDADREPPELRSLDGDGQRKLHLHEEAFEVLGGISDYLESAKRVAALRAQKGKSLSQINIEALDWVGEDLQRLVSEHKSLVRRLQDTPREAAAEEFMRFLATTRR